MILVCKLGPKCALSVQVVSKLPGRDDNMALSRFAQRTHVMTKYKLNPYNGFKSDVERRRALNMRMICIAIMGVAFSQSPRASNLKEILPWLKALVPINLDAHQKSEQAGANEARPERFLWPG